MRTTRIVTLLMLLAFVAPVLADAPKESFISVVPKFDPDRLDHVRTLLTRIETECPSMQQKCPASVELIQEYATKVNFEKLPVFFVYLDDDLQVQASTLLWKGRVTPFVYDVQNVFVLVFMERPVNLDARLLNIWADQKTIANGLRNVFVSSGKRLQEERANRAVSKPLVPEMLARDTEGDELWVAHERFFIEEESAYSLSVAPADDQAREEAGFVQANARFTNSKNRRTAFGVGVGVSFNPSEDVLDSVNGIRTDNGVITGNWMFTVYLRRPILLEPIKSRPGSRYRLTYGVSIGTSFDIFDADQFILGLNIGHVFGRHGIVVGASLFDPTDSPSVDNEVVPYAAAVFNF